MAESYLLYPEEQNIKFYTTEFDVLTLKCVGMLSRFTTDEAHLTVFEHVLHSMCPRSCVRNTVGQDKIWLYKFLRRNIRKHIIDWKKEEMKDSDFVNDSSNDE